MRTGFFGSIGSMLAGACLVFGQTPSSTPPATMPSLAAADQDSKPAKTMESDHKPLTEGLSIGPLSSLRGASDPTCNGVWYGSAEYLLWWIKDARIVPLASNDALGNADAAVLFGGKDITYNKLPFSGGRFTVGYWETECPSVARDNHSVGFRERPWGVETSYLLLADRTTGFSDGLSPTLIRPFFDLNNRQESGSIVAFPRIATGSMAINVNSGLWGAEANFWKNFRHEHFPLSNVRIDLVAGFRYLDLGEDLNISAVTNYFPNQAAFPAFAPFAGNRISQFDLFGTRNRFFGGQLGAAYKWFFDELSIDASVKLGLGVTNEEVNIDGAQVRIRPSGFTTISQGGLLALNSNIGRFDRTQFSFVPEFNLHVNYQISNHVTLLFGYTFLAWSKVVRPGDQVDRVIDITQIPNFITGGATPTGFRSPTPLFKDTDFWATGATLGLEIVW